MSIIGTFTPTKDGGWTGTIRTLTIDVKARFVPNDNRDNDRAPDFRVFAGARNSGLPGASARAEKTRGTISAFAWTIRVWWNRSLRPCLRPLTVGWPSSYGRDGGSNDFGRAIQAMSRFSAKLHHLEPARSSWRMPESSRIREPLQRSWRWCSRSRGGGRQSSR